MAERTDRSARKRQIMLWYVVTAVIGVLLVQVALARMRAPVFMLAARDGELVAPPQLFAVEKLIGTPAHNLRKATAPCRHVGL